MQPGNPQATPYPSAAVGWYSTVLLAVLYWLSVLDRTIISLLVDPIQADIGISDVQFGLLHGMAFAVTFSVFGLAAGTLADRYSRRTIIFASVFIWSLATAACGMAKNFTHLLLARVGVGAGEAGLNPCATSMISDLFPPHRMTLALAVFSLGASAGSGCAYLFGGALVQLTANAEQVTLPLFGAVAPWQSVFLIVGVPGVLIAFLSFTMPEPARRGVQHAPRSTSMLQSIFGAYPALFSFMRSRGRFFFCHYGGFGLASIGIVGPTVWYAAHMAREFGWNGGQIGLGLGVILLFGGFLGKFLCGYFVDRMFRRGYKDAHFRWYAGCLLIATPFGIIAVTGDSPWVFLGGFAVFQMLLTPLNACYMASLNLVTPNQLRGSGVALFTATIGILSLSVGPVLIATFSDYVYGGNAIGKGMATLYVLFLPPAALLLLAGRRAMREAVTEAEQWQTG